MADSAKDLEIKLRATGAEAAASQVDDVVEAVEDLTDAATEAGEAGGEATEAVEGLTEAVEEAGEASEDAQKILDAFADVIEEAMRKAEGADGAIDDLAAVTKDLAEETTAAADATDRYGIEAEVSAEKLVSVIGRNKELANATGGASAEFAKWYKSAAKLGPVAAGVAGGLAVGIVAWHRYRRAMEENRQEAQRLADEVAQTARRIQESFDEVAINPPGGRSWIDELRDAQSDMADFEVRMGHYTAMLDAQAQAEDRLREAVLRRRLASGDIEQDQYDRERADNRIDVLRRQAAAEVERAGDEAIALRRELTTARTLEAEAMADLRRAEADIAEREAELQERQGVVQRMRSRARQLAAANQTIHEGLGVENTLAQLSAADMDTFTRAAAAAAGRFAGVDDEIRAYSDVLEEWLAAGMTIEDYLKQHPQVYKRMTESLAEEAERARQRAESTEAALKEEKNMTDLVARREAALAETTRLEEEVATIRRREAENERARRNARFRRDTIVEGYEVPIINEGVAAADAARERAAREKEEARAQTEALKAERDALLAEREQIQSLIKGMALDFSSRAGRVEDAGLSEAARVLQNASRAMSDGLTLGEGERILFDVARVLEATPENMQRIVESAFAPLRQAVTEHLRRIEQVESRVNNLR